VLPPTPVSTLAQRFLDHEDFGEIIGRYQADKVAILNNGKRVAVALVQSIQRRVEHLSRRGCDKFRLHDVAHFGIRIMRRGSRSEFFTHHQTHEFALFKNGKILGKARKNILARS
jgi:hypothetical protein